MLFRTTYHRDGSVTIWDIYLQQWKRTAQPSDRVFESLSHKDRERIMRHCKLSVADN